MRISSLTPLTLASMGTLLIVVACSPNNGQRLTITEQKPTAMQQAIGACTDTLRTSEKIDTHGQKVNLCEYDASLDGTFGQTLKVVANDVSYSIQPATDKSGRSLGTVHFGHKVALFALSKVDTKEYSQLEAAISNDCSKQISDIFARSTSTGARLSLDLKFHVTTGEEAEAGATSGLDDAKAFVPNQTLYVVKGTDGADSYWMLGQLPGQPKFYATARAADREACRQAGGTPDVQTKCALARRAPVNRAVCAALAKRVGAVMGIVDLESQTKLCNATPWVDPKAVVATATPVPSAAAGSGSSSGSAAGSGSGSGASSTSTASGKQPPSTGAGPDSTFAKPSANDEEFLGKATLNHKDLVTILSPACKNLK